MASVVHPDDTDAMFDVIQRASDPAGDGRYDIDYRIARGDGSYRWLRAWGKAEFEGEGEGAARRAVRIVGASRDVTAEKEAEAARCESEERQAFLLRFSDAIRTEASERGVVEQALRMLAEELALDRCYATRLYPAEDLTEVIHEVREPGLAPMPSSLRNSDFPQAYGQTFDRTLIFDDMANDPVLTDGDKRAFASMGFGALLSRPLRRENSPIFAAGAVSSRPRHWTFNDVALVEDVAERTWTAMERARTESALHESEVRFRTLAETAPALIWQNDAAGANLFVNRYFRDYTGLSAGEIDGEKWRAVVHPDDAEAYVADYMASVSEHRAFHNRCRIRRHDGAWRWFVVYAQPLLDEQGRYRGNVGISTDVHATAEAEVALRESEERLRNFGEASQDVLWVRDAGTLDWIYLTPAFEEVYGVSREQALKGDNFRNWLELIVSEDRDHAKASIDRVVGGELLTFEYRIRRPSDGEVRWLRDTDFPMRDEHGRVVSIGGIGQDVTFIKTVEERLKASEQWQQLLIEGVPQLVWRAYDGGKWTWASPQWTDYTGQAESDSRDYGWLDPVHPDDRERVMDIWAGAIERGEYHADYRIRHAAERRYRWFQARATPVRNGAGDIVEWLGTSTDVDDLRQLQDRQEVLVAELQHRTRNLITVVRAISQQTLRESGSLTDFREHFGDRLSALSRVQGLLSHLSAGQKVTFDELLDTELEALGAPRDKVTLNGLPGVALRSATVQTFSLALHELATNALKYGALFRRRSSHGALGDGHRARRHAASLRRLARNGRGYDAGWRPSGGRRLWTNAYRTRFALPAGGEDQLCDTCRWGALHDRRADCDLHAMNGPDLERCNTQGPAHPRRRGRLHDRAGDRARAGGGRGGSGRPRAVGCTGLAAVRDELRRRGRTGREPGRGSELSGGARSARRRHPVPVRDRL